MLERTVFFYCVLLYASLVSADAQELLSKLSLEEKIAQLCVMRINLDDSDEVFEKKKQNLMRFQPGGVIVLHPGKARKQFEWMQEVRQLSKIPLLFFQDGEWAFSMHLSDIPHYPQAMTLGAITSSELLYRLGRKIGQDSKAFGIHINLAPVVDVNTNPANPVIHTRSFGDDPKKVALKATAFFKGLQDGGVLACVKHFPGHGDTSVDSHFGLPKLMHNKNRLETIELFPFKEAIKAGIDAVMIGHIQVPALDAELDQPASLSYNVMTEILKHEIGFEGLVITDALDMRAVTAYYAPGEIEKEAFIAGADILLCCVDIQAAINTIKNAIDQGSISEKELDERVLKVLKIKEKVIVASENFSFDEAMQVICKEGEALKKELYQNAITLVSDESNLVPLHNECPIALVQIGPGDTFYQTLSETIPFERIEVPLRPTQNDIAMLHDKLKHYSTVLFSFHAINKRKRPNFGIDNKIVDYISALTIKRIVVLFGTPYTLSLFQNVNAVLVGYENDKEAQRSAAQVLCGQLNARGELPIKNPSLME